LVQHLLRNLGRADTGVPAGLTVEEGGARAAADLAHPLEQALVRIVPGRAQDDRGARAPAGRHRHDTQPVRTELLRERAVGHQPAADEVAAGLDRPLRVNRAAALAPEMARLPGLHLVPADIPRHPAIAARRAGS